MKHARTTLAAVALFGLAPLVGCDQNGVEDASTPGDTTSPGQQPPPPPPDRTTEPPARDPGEVEDPGIDDPIDDPAGGG